MEKIRCAKVFYGEQYFVAPVSVAMEYLGIQIKEDYLGEKYVVDVVDITQEELDALPEFDGF